MEEVRRGKWMQTYTGKVFYALDPREEDVSIMDIAHSLSMTCRYTGHVKKFYSVAEHSIIMSKHVPEEFALEALLHDAHEAYLGDMAGMIKGEFKYLVEAEDRLDKVIRKKYGLPLKMSPEVKEADVRMLATEREQVMDSNGKEWFVQKLGIEPFNTQLRFYKPHVAQHLFLRYFIRYMS